MIKEVEHQISKGNTQKAIEILLKYTSVHRAEGYQETLLISSRFKQWEKENMMGLEPSKAELRKIENAILNLGSRLSSPDQQDLNPKNKIKHSKESRFPNLYVIISFILFFIIIVILIPSNIFFQNNPDKATTEERFNLDSMKTLSMPITEQEDRRPQKLNKDKLIEFVYSLDSLKEKEDIEKLFFLIDSVRLLRISDSMALEYLDDLEKELRIMQEYSYDNVFWSFPAMHILTKKGGKYGLHSRDGRTVITPEYDDISPFADPYFFAKKDNYYSVIDSFGNLIIDEKFDSIEYFSDNLWLFMQGEFLAIFNSDGKFTFGPNLLEFHPFGDLIRVKGRNNKWGYIDYLGYEKIPIMYDSASDFRNGLAFVIKGDIRAIIDTSGSPVENAGFDHK